MLNKQITKKALEIHLESHNRIPSPTCLLCQSYKVKIDKLTKETLSKCCLAPIKVWSGEEGTSHYECTTCGCPCDLYVDLKQQSKYLKDHMDEIVDNSHFLEYGETKTDWEMVLDEKVDYDPAETGCDWDLDDIKAFISNLLLQERKSLVKEIKEYVSGHWSVVPKVQTGVVDASTLLDYLKKYE